MTALDKYLTDRSITNEAFADALDPYPSKIRSRGKYKGKPKASAGWVSQIRNGARQPSINLARRIVALTNGEVSFESLFHIGSNGKSAA